MTKTPLNNTSLFGWGCLGAVAPEVLRFFKLAAAGQPMPTLDWPLYWALLIVFVLVSGAFTVAWKAETPFKAIWVGASVPTLVTTLVQVAPSLPKPGP